MDGFHRLAKAHIQGLSALPAVQFEVDPPPRLPTSPPDQLMARMAAADAAPLGVPSILVGCSANSS